MYAIRRRRTPNRSRFTVQRFEKWQIICVSFASALAAVVIGPFASAQVKAPRLIEKPLEDEHDRVLLSDNLPPPWELWTINVDGTGLKQLIASPGFRHGSPDWSPDGKWVAYDRWPNGEVFDAS